MALSVADRLAIRRSLTTDWSTRSSSVLTPKIARPESSPATSRRIVAINPSESCIVCT
jgi:hypothetical protein